MQRIEIVPTSGGFYGLFFGNDQAALSARIKAINAEGGRVQQILPYSNKNVLVILAQILVLILTLGIFANPSIAFSTRNC